MVRRTKIEHNNSLLKDNRQVSHYSGVATLESWLANEVFNVEIVPTYIVERFEQWRSAIEADIESYLDSDDGDGLRSWRDWGRGYGCFQNSESSQQFYEVLGNCINLLGINPKHEWFHTTGVNGEPLLITPEWVIEVGLDVPSNGAEIPTIAVHEPARLAVGPFNGMWFAAINSKGVVTVLQPVATRANVLTLCKALHVTLPAPKVEMERRSSLQLPGVHY